MTTLRLRDPLSLGDVGRPSGREIRPWGKTSLGVVRFFLIAASTRSVAPLFPRSLHLLGYKKPRRKWVGAFTKHLPNSQNSTPLLYYTSPPTASNNGDFILQESSLILVLSHGYPTGFRRFYHRWHHRYHHLSHRNCDYDDRKHHSDRKLHH